MKNKCLPHHQRDMVFNEVKRQLENQTKHIANELCVLTDAVCLYTLYQSFGFGKKRLRRFFEEFNRIYKEMLDFYEMGADTPFVCLQKLKEIGVDLDQWEKEEIEL